jgi:hypothetical protein
MKSWEPKLAEIEIYFSFEKKFVLKILFLILGATPLSDNSAAGKDYYQSMIVAAVIAGVAILAFLVVTGVYLKRTTTYKAIISGDQGGKRRKATFANRAFKVCILKAKFLEFLAGPK